MGRVRVKLDLVFEYDGDGIPEDFAALVDVDRFFEAGFGSERFGDDKPIRLLPGGKLEMRPARAPKRREEG